MRHSLLLSGSGLFLFGLGGCKDLTGSQPLPAGTQNPAFYRTPTGAVSLQAQALAVLAGVVPAYVVHTGLLTDELQSDDIGASPSVLAQVTMLPSEDAVNARVLPEFTYGTGLTATDQEYTALQHVRGLIGQALAAVAAYDTGAKAIGDPKVLRAELFALQGYTELLLADAFCSGVPLSTLDFNGDYTYRTGSTTAQVYHNALIQEDSALALADTSALIQNLARVLKGRILLALDSAASAAQVVAVVPDGFQYQLTVDFSSRNPNIVSANQLNDMATVADQEGENGLPYLTSDDPRTTSTVVFPAGQSNTSRGVPNSVPLTFPTKYSYTGSSPFVVASGVEARLIEAEAALKAGSSSWLTTLNTLRTDGSSTTVPADTILDTLGVTQCGGTFGICGTFDTRFAIAGGQPVSGFPPAGYSLVSADTVWPAPAINGDPSYILIYCNNNSWYEPCYSGDTMVVLHYVRPASTQWAPGTGGVANLAPLSDPGPSSTNADSARVALLFRERAFWFFLTGHRQGDLRRLLRQYPQWFHSQAQVYPTGPYSGLGTVVYGSAVTAPIAGTEYLNPLFHGCIDRNP